MARTLAIAGGSVPSKTVPTSRSGLAAVLVAPWRATRRGNLWTTVPIYGLCCAAALAFGIWAPDRRGVVLAMIFYSAGTCFLWGFGLSGLLLLARDARRLALPHAVRASTLSAWLYGALTIALPTAVAAAAGAQPALVALLAALATLGGLAFVLLPRWLSTWMGFLPAIYIALHQGLHILSPFGASFLYTGLAGVLVLLAAVALCWRRILRGHGNDVGGWSTPVILALHQQAVSSGWSFDKQLLWQRSARESRFTNLRGIDARAPARAIEVCLGALYVPQTPLGILVRLGMVAWPVLVFAIAMALVDIGHAHDLRRLIATMGIGGAMWSGAFGITMVLFAATAMLKRRWEQGSEPALLALLPGLGRHASLSRSLLRAAAIKPLGVCVLLWAVMLGCEAWLHLGSAALALTTLAVFGMTAAAALSLLRTFAGRPLSTMARVLLAGGAFVLMCVSLPLAFAAPLARLGPAWIAAEWALIVAWVLVGAWLAVLALRAWNLLQTRPHPFLGNVS